MKKLTLFLDVTLVLKVNDVEDTVVVGKSMNGVETMTKMINNNHG